MSYQTKTIRDTNDRYSIDNNGNIIDCLFMKALLSYSNNIFLMGSQGLPQKYSKKLLLNEYFPSLKRKHDDIDQTKRKGNNKASMMNSFLSKISGLFKIEMNGDFYDLINNKLIPYDPADIYITIIINGGGKTINLHEYLYHIHKGELTIDDVVISVGNSKKLIDRLQIINYNDVVYKNTYIKPQISVSVGWC